MIFLNLLSQENLNSTLHLIESEKWTADHSVHWILYREFLKFSLATHHIWQIYHSLVNDTVMHYACIAWSCMNFGIGIKIDYNDNDEW